MENKKDFFLECYQLGIIKFGKFTLKSGIESPFYVDLRPLASDAKILKKLGHYLLQLVSNAQPELICGVPYAALPMATAMALESEIPLIIKRKEAKSYGTKKLIEGIFEKGQSCLVVEDVITSGKSLLETIPEIENEGIKVSEIVVVLDREQGGKELLEEKGYQVRTLFTIREACQILVEAGKITEEEQQRIEDFVKGNAITFEKPKRKSYKEKLAIHSHSKAQKLLQLAMEKESNLIASADVVTTAELLDFAEKVGPHIVALKTHADIITDFDYEKTIVPLLDIAQKHRFLLMEDRKFADIGSTQELQYSYGIHRISSWADLITSQVIGGAKSLDFFLNSGVISIIGMSSEGTLTDANYRAEAIKVAQANPNVIGGVSQDTLPGDLLLFTPGVNIDIQADGKGQQYNSPEVVFSKLGTDFIIVGRGIYKAEDAEQAALQYKIAGWNAYLENL